MTAGHEIEAQSRSHFSGVVAPHRTASDELTKPIPRPATTGRDEAGGPHHVITSIALPRETLLDQLVVGRVEAHEIEPAHGHGCSRGGCAPRGGRFSPARKKQANEHRLASAAEARRTAERYDSTREEVADTEICRHARVFTREVQW